MIEIRHISKAFGDHVVLYDLSYAIPEGKISIIMGPSGVGKTTFVRLLLGLESPDTGEISGLEGKKLSSVFQEDRLCENLTAGANIRLVLPEQLGTTQDTFQDITKQKSGGYDFDKLSTSSLKFMRQGFEAMGLPETSISQKVKEMSGGERRRVSILRALMADYDIMVLDEPFKGLDEETKEDVMAYTKKSVAGKTVVMITHDRREAEFMGGEIIEL